MLMTCTNHYACGYMVNTNTCSGYMVGNNELLLHYIVLTTNVYIIIFAQCAVPNVVDAGNLRF